jgi:hypothetical protein
MAMGTHPLPFLIPPKYCYHHVQMKTEAQAECPWPRSLSKSADPQQHAGVALHCPPGVPVGVTVKAGHNSLTLHCDVHINM